jgi:hypothetical protein
MKSHTGGVMSMGTGAAYSASKKQKLNTKSTTESELVGIDDILPQALWTKYFMESQGYGITTIMNQDNQSTINLANNGKASSGWSTRHINIRYFFSLPTIGSPARKWRSNTAQPRKWSPTILRNPSKVYSSISSVIKLWVWSPWILSWGTTGVCWIRNLMSPGL